MNQSTESKNHRAYGALMLVFAGLAWAGAVYFAMVPKKELPPPVQASQVDVGSCKAALSELGYSVIERGDDLSLSEALSPFPQQQLEKASLAAVLCKTEMRSFCMGEGCERQGLVLTLKKPEVVRPAEPAKGSVGPGAPAARPALSSGPSKPTPGLEALEELK